MILDSFLEERAKIAAAGGSIDVRALHRKNLEDQKRDLEGSMKRSAYPKGIGIGALMGGAVPSLMGVGTALNDMDEVQKRLSREHLTNVFEKAIKGDKELAKDLSDEVIRSRASAAARYYMNVPEAIRNNDGEYILRAIKRQYTDPSAKPAWVGPRGLENPILKSPLTYTSDGRPVFSQEAGDFLNSLMESQNAARRGEIIDLELGNWRARPYSITPRPADALTERLPPRSGFESHVRDLQDRFIGAIENAIKGTGTPPPSDVPVLPRNALLDHAVRHARGTYRASPLEPYVPPNALGESTPDGREMMVLIKKIQDMHGKPKLPDMSAARISTALDALKKSKKALIASAAAGGILGGVSVRRKRKAARSLQP